MMEKYKGVKSGAYTEILFGGPGANIYFLSTSRGDIAPVQTRKQ